MTKNFDPTQVGIAHVEAFCAECGAIQQGRWYPAIYSGWQLKQKQMVIVHCTDCGAVTRHYGNVRISHTGRMSVIPGGEE